MSFQYNNKTVMALAAVLAIGVALVGCGGGGGGGGPTGGGSTVTVTGTVVRVDTGVPPIPHGTVQIAGKTATTGSDGTFTVTGVPSGTTSATFTAPAETAQNVPATQPLTLALSLTAGQAVNNLGSIYLSPTGYTATATGRVVTLVSGQKQPVAGAVVSLAGHTTTSAADGTFTLTGLPVGLGETAGFFGKISKTGYDEKPITADVLQFPLVAGSNPLGDLIVAVGSGTATPGSPFTIQGTVNVKGVATQGINVTLMQGTTFISQATTDANGAYSFWVVPGAYTVTATSSTGSAQANVTLVRQDQPVTAPTINL